MSYHGNSAGAEDWRQLTGDDRRVSIPDLAASNALKNQNEASEAAKKLALDNAQDLKHDSTKEYRASPDVNALQRIGAYTERGAGDPTQEQRITNQLLRDLLKQSNNSRTQGGVGFE
jgi:hypothetical protein